MQTDGAIRPRLSAQRHANRLGPERILRHVRQLHQQTASRLKQRRENRRYAGGDLLRGIDQCGGVAVAQASLRGAEQVWNTCYGLTDLCLDTACSSS